MLGSSQVRRPPLAAESPAPAGSIPPLLAVLFGLLLPLLVLIPVATTSEPRALAIIAGMAVVVTIVVRPYVGLLLFVGLVYVRLEETVPEMQGLRLPLLIGGVTTLGLFLHLVLRRERMTRTPVNAMMLGFAAAVVISSLGHGNTGAAVIDMARLVVMVLLVLNLVRTPRTYDVLVTAVIAFTAYLAVFSMYRYYTGGALNYQNEILRSQGTGIFSDPNDLAATMVAGLFLALVRIRASAGAGRVGYVLLCLLIGSAILLTNSRGGMLALLLGLGAFTLLSIRNKGLAITLAVIGILGVLAVGPSRMTSFDAGEESANSRFWFWDNSVQHFVQSPVTGVGYNAIFDVNNGMTAHNSFVLCFTEAGFPGYCLWMGALFYAFKSRKRGPDEPEPDPADELRLLGARLAFGTYLAACFWISRTYSPTMYLLLALPAAAGLIARGHGALPPKLLGSGRDWLAIVGLCAGSIVGIAVLANALK